MWDDAAMLRRPGVTKVEVLVGVAIVVLVGGLLLSGTCRIRDLDSRMKCANNLKQLGLAVHNYEDTNGTLPPFVDQGDAAPTGRGLPSLFGLLPPYIEGTTLVFRTEQPPDRYYAHSSVEFNWLHKGHPHTEHGGMANQIYRVFLDPADDTARDLRDVPMTLPDGTTGYYAAGSYAANGLVPWGTGNLGKSFPRGTQNTVLMAERPQVCRTATGEEVHNLWGVGFYSPQMPAFACLTPTEPPGLASTGQAAPVVPLPPEDGPVMVRIGRMDAAPQPADFPTPFQRVRDGRCDPRLPGGPHPAGMQVLMADGSVRVFDWDTSPWVFWSACVP
jgi:prepilin-type processing-associated H-X9-DG protein